MIQVFGRIDSAHGNQLFGDVARAAVLTILRATTWSPSHWSDSTLEALNGTCRPHNLLESRKMSLTDAIKFSCRLCPGGSQLTAGLSLQVKVYFDLVVRYRSADRRYVISAWNNADAIVVIS